MKNFDENFWCRNWNKTFDVETETGITECYIINNLLTELARAVLVNIGPKANIPQHGPSKLG